MFGAEKEHLKDVCAMTGASLVDNEYLLHLRDVEYKHFGRAAKIQIDEGTTHIVSSGKTEELISTRIEEIKRTILEEEKHQMKGTHKERLARLQAKIAEIGIGGSTDVERGEERDIFVDALNSARSAMMHGVLPGGGVALYQASKLLERGLPHLASERSEEIGIRVLGEALKEPIKTLIHNKTAENPGPIIAKLDEAEGFFIGYDV